MDKALLEMCLAPARQAQHMHQLQAAQKVPVAQWHHGKVSWGRTEGDGTEKEAARAERRRFGSFYCQTHGNCPGLLSPSSPSWQPPLCCQAQAKFPLVRGKASRSTCYGFIQYSFNHILKCEINGTAYIPLFFIWNKFIFTLGMQLNTRVMKKHSF